MKLYFHFIRFNHLKKILKVTYANRLLQMTKSTDKKLDTDHVNNISALFQLDEDGTKASLMFDNVEFADLINEQVLEILKSEALKEQKFEKEIVFTLMETILDPNRHTELDTYVVKVMEILGAYKYPMPESTIAAFENAIKSTSELSENAFNVIQKIAQDKQCLSYATLRMLTDILLMSNNPNQRVRAFQILDNSMANQPDLPDEIFFIIELQRAALGLFANKKNGLSERSASIIEFIRDQTNNSCRQLPIDTMDALEDQAYCMNSSSSDLQVHVLEIFLSVSKNKQMLSYNLLDKLIAAYNPESISDANRLLIEIFASVSRNNQDLSSDLLPKLEKSLKCSDTRISTLAVSIFVNGAQRGEPLPDNVLSQLLDIIQLEKDEKTKQEYIGALPSILQVNSDVTPFQTKLKRILITSFGLTESIQMQTNAIETCQALVSKTLILADPMLLKKLYKAGTHSKCETSLKNKIHSLLEEARNLSRLNEDTFRKFEMANLKFNSPEQLLNTLGERVKMGTCLLPVNYKQLADIIELTDESKYLHLALNMLEENEKRVHKNRQYLMTNGLVENLKLLFERSRIPEIKDKCSKLLNNNIRQKLSKKMKDKETAINTENTRSSTVSPFIYLRDELNLDTLNKKTIGDLLVKLIQSDRDLEEIEQLLHTFIVDWNSRGSYQNSSFVLLVEELLLLGVGVLSPSLVSKALECLNRIIKDDIATEAERILDYISGSLLENFTEKDQKKPSAIANIALLPMLLECIYNAILLKENDQPQQQLSENCMKMIIFSVQNNSDVRVRSLAFRALRMSKSIEFDAWLVAFLEQLNHQNVELSLQDEKDLDLLEIIVSLNHVDMAVFTHVKEHKLWARELFAYNIFTEFRASEQEQVEFYNSLIFVIEEAKFDEVRRLITLIQEHIGSTFKSMVEINEMLVIVNVLSDLDTVFEAFEDNILPLESLKVQWCSEMISKQATSIDQLNMDYLVKLSKDIWSNKQLSVAFVQGLFQFISTIDNIKEFVSLVKLCAKQKVSLDEVRAVKADSISELKTLIEINLMCRCLVNSADTAQRDLNTLSSMLLDLMKNKSWTAKQVNNILQGVKSLTTLLSPKTTVQNSIDFFNVIIQFNIPNCKYGECLSIFKLKQRRENAEGTIQVASSTMIDALTKLNKIGVENSFEKLIGDEKNASELIDELLSLNATEDVKHVKEQLLCLMANVHEMSAKSMFDLHSEIFQLFGYVIVLKDNVFLINEGIVRFENGQFTCESTKDKQENTKNTMSLEEYFKSKKNSNKVVELLNGDLDGFLKRKFGSKHSSDLIKEKIKKIPELVEKRTDEKGMQDAIEVLNYKDEEHYLVHYTNTILKKLEKTSINLFNTPIDAWDEKQILSWSNIVKRRSEDLNIVEAIAVIKRAIFINSRFHLNNAQILCCLIAFQSDETTVGASNMSKKLLQVKTGEGKSTIVCILAIVSALRKGNAGNSQVDVITSSPVLAARDAKDKSTLYAMFGLTCSNNDDVSVYKRGAKSCYKADIVYGEMSQFQFDKLRDNYSQLQTLAGRQANTAIFDEADAMFIDECSNIAKLSSTSAGMDHLQPIYVFIWQKLMSIKDKFIVLDDRIYFMKRGQTSWESGKLSFELADENGDIFKLDDLEKYLNDHFSENQNFELVRNGQIVEFLKVKLEEHLEFLFETKKIQVPPNLKDFFKKQRPKWILNAIEALNFHENVHYIIQDGQIKPVDFFSTGIVRSNTSWSDGCHQFLELKHNLALKSETLTTNFLSNVGFINSYDKIIGLTGTLGSEKDREFLKEVKQSFLSCCMISSSCFFCE